MTFYQIRFFISDSTPLFWRFRHGDTTQIMHTWPLSGRVLILSGADDYLDYILFNNRDYKAAIDAFK